MTDSKPGSKIVFKAGLIVGAPGNVVTAPLVLVIVTVWPGALMVATQMSPALVSLKSAAALMVPDRFSVASLSLGAPPMAASVVPDVEMVTVGAASVTAAVALLSATTWRLVSSMSVTSTRIKWLSSASVNV